MTIKLNNKNVVAMEKFAAEAASGSDKPYALMIKHAGLAAAEGAIAEDDRDAFYKRLDKANGDGHKTILNNRRSEAWSCVKLAFEYKQCAAAIFANIEKATPTPSGIYDIACSIRSKAHFAEGKPCAKKAINLHADSGVAPTVEKMKQAMVASNAYRNGLSGASADRPLVQVVGGYAKMLEAFRDGKRDPKTGKVRKDSKGNAITLPKLTSDKLGAAIAALRTYETELNKPSNGKVVKFPAKRKAA